MEGYLMITEIGITAGHIWHYLDDNPQATLEELAKNIGVSKEMVLMSLGWLAREGHVTLREDKGIYRASLARK